MQSNCMCCFLAKEGSAKQKMNAFKRLHQIKAEKLLLKRW